MPKRVLSYQSLDENYIPPRPGAPVPPYSPTKTGYNSDLDYQDPDATIRGRKRFKREGSLKLGRDTSNEAVERLLDISEPPSPHHAASRSQSRNASRRLSFTGSTMQLDRRASFAHNLRALGQTLSRRGSRSSSFSSSFSSGGFASSDAPESPVNPLDFQQSLDDAILTLKDSPITRSQVWNERSSPRSGPAATSTPIRPPSALLPEQFAKPFVSDLIIKSNDQTPVLFAGDTSTIFGASPVLKRRANVLGTKTMRKGKAHTTLTVDDPASSIRSLLSLIYDPGKRLDITTASALDDLLDVARRYQCLTASHALCSVALRDLAVHEPLRAFGLACKHNLRTEIAWTAQETLRIDIAKADVSTDLKWCDKSQIEQLIKMHRRQKLLVKRIVASSFDFDEFKCPGEGCKIETALWWRLLVGEDKDKLHSRLTDPILWTPEAHSKCLRSAAQVCNGCLEHYIDIRTQRRLARLRDDVKAVSVTFAHGSV